jgi:D-aminoacyl-tRNA deacylase
MKLALPVFVLGVPLREEALLSEKLANRNCFGGLWHLRDDFSNEAARGIARATLTLMRAVIQRVTQAKVEVDGAVTGEIGPGLLVLLGVGKGDTASDAEFLADKITGLRIFSDDAGKMNRSLLDAGGALLAVSQFTLYGDARKGRRPSFDSAAPAELAKTLYEHFVAAARRSGVRVETGIFQASMLVSLTNDGPVTLILESAGSSQSGG